MPASWNQLVNSIMHAKHPSYQDVEELLLGYEELEFPQKGEPAGQTYTAEVPSTTNETKSGKKKKRKANVESVYSVGSAIHHQNYSGLTTENFNRWMSEKLREAEQRGAAKALGKAVPTEILFTKGKGKGKKGGKGSKANPKSICYNCQGTGHFAADCWKPRQERPTSYGQNPSFKGKGGKGTKTGNPAVGLAPY